MKEKMRIGSSAATANGKLSISIGSRSYGSPFDHYVDSGYSFLFSSITVP
jgi:hypothetical protein